MSDEENRPASNSTIAQVMTGREDGVGRKRSRQSAIAEQILKIVSERPGVTASEIAREIGEKAIFVLSLADELIRHGQLISPERDGKLHIPAKPGQKGSTAPEESVSEKPDEDADQEKTAEQSISNEDLTRLREECHRLRQSMGRYQTAGLLVDFHRLIAPLAGLRVGQGNPLTVMLGDRKFMVVSPRDDFLSISIHGKFPDSALIDLTEGSEGARARVQIAPKEHLIDVKCANAEEIRSLGPGLKKCYEHLRDRRGA